VSYNNPESAELAIKNMNGFVVGHKRLKVEQKKDKHQLMPPTGTAPFSAAYLAPLQR
jgi:RNA recognition motif-containing protein